MVIDEFSLKAMVEQEDDDILISKVRSRSLSSDSQNDKLINGSSTSCHYCWFYLCSFLHSRYFMISSILGQSLKVLDQRL